MNIQDIRNMGFAELKERRDELVESLRAEPSAEGLEAVFIHALTNAKQRDEKLAEQGKTITFLQDGLEASKVQAEAATTELTETKADLDVVLANAKTAGEKNARALFAQQTVIEEAGLSLQQESQRADRLKAEATRNHAAVSGAAKLLNDALAAQAVENADSGE